MQVHEKAPSKFDYFGLGGAYLCGKGEGLEAVLLYDRWGFISACLCCDEVLSELCLRGGLRLMLLEEARQRDEVFDAELLRALGEDLCRVARVVGTEERLE